jgi:hypothetical protein
VAQPSVDPRAILEGGLSISDKIRRLHAAGYSRARIADLVDRSYQQVRQVLVEDERRANRGRAAAPRAAPRATVQEPAVAFEGIVRLEVQAGGVIQLPPEVQAALNMRAGGVLIGELGPDRLVILSARAAALKAQALIAGLGNNPDRLLSEELIADRRAEAAREEVDG